MKNKIKSKKAEGFVDSGVKILIAVVIGALLLGGTYTLTKDTVMASAKEKVEAMFDYKGVTVEPVEEEIKPTLFSFTIPQGTFDAEEGMTWGEWVNSEYNSTSLSVVGNEIGRDDGNGAGVYLYYKQNGKNVYVKPNELVDSNKYYQPEIRFPIIYF